jgi:uncharacterized protein YjbI with pentapeptide repeats
MDCHAAKGLASDVMQGIVVFMTLDITEIIRAHSQWLHSAGQEGNRANFRGADLTGREFLGVDLSQASFRNAVLNRTTFTGCNLEDADFAEVTGDSPVFTDCTMRQINFARAHVINGHVTQSALDNASFLQARFDSAQMQHVTLHGANFRDAIMPSWRLHKSGVEQATLRGLRAQHANISHVRMDRVDGRDADFSFTHFEEVAWHGAGLRNAVFHEARFKESDLTTAEEVDPASVSVAERTHAAHKEEELQTLERQRNLILELQHVLTMREEKINEHQERLGQFRHDLALQEVSIRQRASSLRVIAACWCMLVAMLLVFLLDRFAYYMPLFNEMEAVALGVGLFLLLVMQVAVGVITYRASRQLWALIEQREALK